MFDPERLFSVLVDEGVQFVLIGGLAAVMHGSPLPTVDVDVVPDRSAENLGRLADALNRLGAKLRTAGGPVETTIDAGFLLAMPLMLNLETDAGDLDLTFEPAGPRIGFAGWNEDAVDMELSSGVTIRVAGLRAVIDSKRAADRPKDLRALPYLESLLDEIEKETDDSPS